MPKKRRSGPIWAARSPRRDRSKSGTRVPSSPSPVADLRAALRPQGKAVQPLGRSPLPLSQSRARSGVRRTADRHSPARGAHRPDRRDRHGQNDADSIGAAASRSTDVHGLRAGPVRVARRPAQDAARGLRRRLARRSETRQPCGRVTSGSELPALRVPRFARPAAGLRRHDHRRSAEPAARTARGDPHPLGPRTAREAAAGRARRPARAQRRT